MITEQDIAYVYNGIPGTALAIVIDEDSVYDFVLHEEYAQIFLGFDDSVDISDHYPDHNGITVRLLKDGQPLEDFQTSEYLGSILLSNPVFINLNTHNHGLQTMSPHAKFINNEFITTDWDSSSQIGFLPQFLDQEVRDSICATHCQCYKLK
jgi:hypothetical protein